MKSSLLQIKNLSKAFPVKKNFWGKVTEKLYAVNDISFEVKAGECFVIVGESGCGKSTTAKLITRLIEPDSGEIIFDGQNWLALNSKDLRQQRPKMQMVFQNPFSSLDPNFTIFDSIAEPMEIHKIYNSKEELQSRVYELLEMVDLEKDLASKYPHQCSGGQNQRVSIARAIALNPKLVIADEAVSALDVSVQHKILELIKDLQNKLGISFIFIAHNLGVVKAIADRVAVMYLGEIVEEGNCEEIFTKPKHPYTKALINSAPVPDPSKRDREKIFLTGEIPKPTNIPLACPFHTRCPEVQESCKNTKPELKIHKDSKVSCLLY